MLLLLDEAGRVRFASGQLERLGGRSIDALVGTAFADSLDPTDLPTLETLLQTARRRPPGELTGPVRLPYLHLDGSKRVAEAWAVSRLDDPELSGIVVLLLMESAFDHFDQVLATVVAGARAEESLAAIAVALRHPPVGTDCFFVVVSPDGRSVKRWPDRTGVPGPPLHGPWDTTPTAGTVVPTDIVELPEDTRSVAASAGYRAVACYPVKAIEDSAPEVRLVVWSRQRGALPANAQVAVDRALVLATLALSHTAVVQLIDPRLRDAVTGLGNRRGFLEATRERVQAGESPTVLVVGVNGMEDLSETRGRLAADATLRALARRLSATVRPTDDLASLGDGEFAVLCDGEVPEVGASAIAQRLIRRVAEPVGIPDSEPVGLKASVGVALGFPAGTPAEQLLVTAARALSEAKTSGNGGFKIAAPR